MPFCCSSCEFNCYIEDNLFESKSVCDRQWLLKYKHKIITWSDESIRAEDCPEYKPKSHRTVPVN